MHAMQAGEIEITAIQDIDCAGFDKKFVEDVDIVDPQWEQHRSNPGLPSHPFLGGEWEIFILV